MIGTVYISSLSVLVIIIHQESRLAATQWKAEEVKDIMLENMNKVDERKEKLEDLEDRSAKLLNRVSMLIAFISNQYTRRRCEARLAYSFDRARTYGGFILRDIVISIFYSIIVCVTLLGLRVIYTQCKKYQDTVFMNEFY
uniref:V-SNARE coiled-coil homology domain-containing protein n=1 Tax=Astyanax mexicanus TaxID=7994 RepID=A0A8B9HMF7_ASTMX